MNYAEDLDKLIRESCIANLKELEELWITMGLSTEEIDERMDTVRSKISDITTEMVECDRDNKMMIEEACNNRKKDIQVLRRKLKITGDPEPLSSGLPLLEMLRKLELNLLGLEKKKQEIMAEFRSLIDEERALATKLGLEAVYIDEDSIPEKEDMARVEENRRTMALVKEERETQMLTMKEHIVTLLDCLGLDLKGTLSSVLDGEDIFDSLKLTNLKSVQRTLEELRTNLDQKKGEVNDLMKNIASLYARLDIPSSEQCPLSTGQVCGVEQLIKEDKMIQLREEKIKLEIMKMENMTVFISNARSELAGLWKACLVGKEEQSLFLAGIDGDTDETLTAVETEISRLRQYLSQHKDIFQKIVVYLEMCNLAEDLKERMQDPNRLFKSRGNPLFQEEQDRRKVKMIPRRKDELLALAQHRGNLMIFDKPLSTLVEDHALVCAELFPPTTPRADKNQTPSSTRGGKSFSRTANLQSNKTATPRSTKKLGKYHISPVGRNTTRNLRTPLSAQPTTPTRIQGRMVGASPLPLVRSDKRVTGVKTPLGTCRTNTFSRRMQNSEMPDLVQPIPLNDCTINESAFSDNVPCNSTVMYDTFPSRCIVPDVCKDTENTVVLSGLIDKMVPARDAADLQDRTRAQKIGQSATSATGRYNTRVLAGSKIPRQATSSQPSAKMTRKLRRSKSCSEIVLASRKHGGQRPRFCSKPEGQDNLPSIRESGATSRPAIVRSNSCLTASGSRKCARGGDQQAVQGRVQ